MPEVEELVNAEVWPEIVVESAGGYVVNFVLSNCLLGNGLTSHRINYIPSLHTLDRPFV
jgi:hypothetical protein